MNQLLWISGLTLLSLTIGLDVEKAGIASPEALKKNTFQNFINQFEQVAFPLEIGVDQLQDSNLEHLGDEAYRVLQKESRSRNLEGALRDYVPGRSPRYGRIPPDEYEPYALLAKNENYVAVVVAGKHAFSLKPSYYTLVTYTPEGDVISELKIAERLGLAKFKTAQINKDLKISTLNKHLGEKEEVYEEKNCAVLSNGELFPSAEKEEHSILRLKRKKKKQRLNNARASII